MIEQPIIIHPENLAIDTKMFIGALQITFLFINGFVLPAIIFETQREMRVFGILVGGYVSIFEEIYIAIKESDERERM